MFYSNQILARKGPLGLVWIAAHLDRQLKRQQINSTSIPASVDTLLDPEVPLALRLSGQLLLGVVRIYARKVNYLQQDCSDALIKIRVALRPADGVNLPPGSATAPVEQITLLAPGRNGAAGVKGQRTTAAESSRAAALHEDGTFEIDIEDFYWEQDVLLGRDGANSFTSFDLAGGLDLGLAPSGSGPLSQDISGVFGMHSSSADFNQEVFDIADEEAAAVWDLDELEVERLRAAGSQQQHSSGVSGLMGLTPGVEGPTGKGAAVATSSPADSDAEIQRPTGAAAADLDLNMSSADGQPVGNDGEMSEGSQSVQHGDAADEVPPTPADALLDSDAEGAAAGYTGGAAAGFTPGSVGGLLPPTPDVDLTPAEDATADMMDIDAAPLLDTQQEEEQQQQQQGQEGETSQQEPQAADVQDQQQQDGDKATKTFQRRRASQQQKNESEAAAASSAATAVAKIARQRRTAALLGHKRRVIVDDHRLDGEDGAAGKRQPSTELPASEIRALLADRSSLMVKSRGQSLLGKRSQPDTQQVSTAAPTPAELLQLQLAPSDEAAAAAAGPHISNSRGAAPAGGSDSAKNAGSSTTVAGNAGISMCLWSHPVSAAVGLVGVIGGLGGVKLPAEIHGLFLQAAQAAKGGAAAVAPMADLGQIDMAGDDEVAAEVYGSLAGTAGAANAKGVTRNSLSLSLSTPGSAAAATTGTPATVAGGEQKQKQAEGPGSSEQRSGRHRSAAAGLTPGYDDGYTPGTIGHGAASFQHGVGETEQQQQQQQPEKGQDNDFMDATVPLDFADQLQYEQEEDGIGERTSAGIHETPAGGDGVHREGRLPWPADAETLQEQAVDGADVGDGGFTSRTRLVMKHLQHAAGASISGTPATSSRRRISAAPPASLAAAAEGKEAEDGTAAAGGAPSATLSFNDLTQTHNRLDACRWFYEVLVLSNKGLVRAKQSEPYGDIMITPQLAAMARM